eukprot:GILK01034914.1.p2 GENE.GILK01034914.1~~GILK01034914.1.p2  ORF type:complete len:107 (-),score=0.98 GILK01034914.1:25-345(-)
MVLLDILQDAALLEVMKWHGHAWALVWWVADWVDLLLLHLGLATGVIVGLLPCNCLGLWHWLGLHGESRLAAAAPGITVMLATAKAAAVSNWCSSCGGRLILRWSH